MNLSINETLPQLTRYGVYGVIISRKSLLLTLKKKGPYAGKWDLPGGGIEFGESPEETLHRELIEEIAHVPKQFHFLMHCTHVGKYYKEESPYLFHHIGILYEVSDLEPYDKGIAEEEMKWMALDSLRVDQLTPFAQKALLLFK